MRTNIEIDNSLMAEMLAEHDVRSKRAAVETALKEALAQRRQLRAQGRIRELWGIGWAGDLEAMRLD